MELRWSLGNSIKFPGDKEDAGPHKEPHIYPQLTVDSSLGVSSFLWILTEKGFTQNIYTEVKRESEH